MKSWEPSEEDVLKRKYCSKLLRNEDLELTTESSGRKGHR
jgi:hypothetical protein